MGAGEYYELRAKPFDSDKWIYGEIYDAGYGFFINRTEIDPRTVQRLAGYDEEGNEVFKSVRL